MTLPYTGPPPSLTKGGVVNWLGGGDARHPRSVDLEVSGGHAPPDFFL